MYKGLVVENSLKDPRVLRTMKVDLTYKLEDWTLHEVRTTENELPKFQAYLNGGPWYVHFWEEGGDNVKVIFKDRTFDIRYSDKETWKDAVRYGQSLGIPLSQLDFSID
jgi:hypothetical protein